jgi:hypothetical protein
VTSLAAPIHDAPCSSGARAIALHTVFFNVEAVALPQEQPDMNALSVLPYADFGATVPQMLIQIINNDIYYAARRNRINKGPEVLFPVA